MFKIMMDNVLSITGMTGGQMASGGQHIILALKSVWVTYCTPLHRSSHHLCSDV